MELFREKKWLPILAAVLLVAAIGIAFWIALREGTSPDDVPEPAVEDEAVWGTAPEETLGIAVQTPYLTFHYPKDWEDMTVENLSEDGRSLTVFRTELSGETAELFSVILSPKEEEDYLLGRLNLQDGSSVNVYTCVNELDTAMWSEEDYATLCIMQERINDIIAQIYENAAFVPN